MTHPTLFQTMLSFTGCSTITPTSSTWTGGASSPRPQGTCTSPWWRPRTWATTPASSPAPRSARASSASPSPSSPSHRRVRDTSHLIFSHLIFSSTFHLIYFSFHLLIYFSSHLPQYTDCAVFGMFALNTLTAS